jgi:hypothetical protein
MTDSPNGDHSPLKPLQQELDRLIADNKAGFTEIARMGAQVDPGGLLNLRIDTLAEMAFGGPGSPGMTEFGLRFERKVALAIEEIRGQVRKAQLAAGANISPQQVRQMAQQQGLLGPDGNPVKR